MGVRDFSGFALHIHQATILDKMDGKFRLSKIVGRGERWGLVEIGLEPSFHMVISSHGHWCRSLDFD